MWKQNHDSRTPEQPDRQLFPLLMLADSKPQGDAGAEGRSLPRGPTMQKTPALPPQLSTWAPAHGSLG